MADSITKLSSPIKELVQSAAESDATLLGTSDQDKKTVAEWLEKAGEVKSDSYKELEITLAPRTYIATNYLSAADVALYGALHPILSKLEPAQYYTHPSITRYFDHIQTRPVVRSSSHTLPVVEFDFENSPKIERLPDPPKQKKDKAKAAPAAEESKSKDVVKETKKETEGKNVEKKDKKNKEKAAAGQEGGKKDNAKGDKKAAKAAPADDGPPTASMIDLRVGHIVDVQKHPDADGLYIEQIDIGEETPRTVVSGLVNYIPIEQMRDKWLVAVCNLKPANMRGVKSYAMVLCATSKDGKEGGIEFIDPPANSKPGDRVYFEGQEDSEPLSQLNPKKKIFETIQPGFTTLPSKEAAWINPETKSVHRIRTKEGVCTAPTLVGASLS